MAQLDHNNVFQKWIMTDQERIIGTILYTGQKQCIQNQIAMAAEEKVALTFDPANPLAFAQREAELQGTIKALQYLITLSNAAEQEQQELQTPQE